MPIFRCRLWCARSAPRSLIASRMRIAAAMARSGVSKVAITASPMVFTAAPLSDAIISTEIYDRVGDIVAFDLVNEHFGLLQESIAAESGAVVSIIADCAMA